MLLRLLLLKRLSPRLFALKLAGLVAVGVLFLAFVAQCGYLLWRNLQRPSRSIDRHIEEQLLRDHSSKWTEEQKKFRLPDLQPKKPRESTKKESQP
ncbi:MAG: hypothetical protein SFV18_16225 [Bryobacteraceae bacterium]|nr:hypothetical protein [Bryobacteraceae bacterium]